MASANTGISIGIISLGAILVYGAVENVSPLAAIDDILHGNKPIPGPHDSVGTQVLKDRIDTGGGSTSGSDSQSTGAAAGSGMTQTSQSAVGDSSATSQNQAQRTANQALGQQMAAQSPYGWTGAEWVALNNIVMSESGWDALIVNDTSTASGIAQNINGWSSDYQRGNAPQQISWLLSYIKDRYGDPIAAWTFHLAHNWY